MAKSQDLTDAMLKSGIKCASALAPGTRLELPDAKVPGLLMRVTPNGKWSWSFAYRINGRRARLTLGSFLPSV
jgi:hypothetical protein